MCSHCDGGSEYRETIEADARARRREEAQIKVVCAWCDETMREGSEPASHGICRACLQKNCPHVLLRWNASKGQFECRACDRPIDAPELTEPKADVSYYIGPEAA